MKTVLKCRNKAKVESSSIAYVYFAPRSGVKHSAVVARGYRRLPNSHDFIRLYPS